MRNKLYIVAIAALALTACSNNENEIFDESAAVRLENFKNSYSEMLSSDGGLWTFEYFANAESQGYLYVVKFDKSEQVTFYANHKWIGNVLKEQSSHWTMIADNGPVLSFNSYNDLFHIFSDPKNITGQYAPTDGEGESERDIDETGQGHEGDYEFQVMEVSEDGNTIRLLGKKRSIDAYLHRLDPSTDIQKYMDEYKSAESNLFSYLVPTLKFTDDNGEEYVVNVTFFKNVYKGVLDICPMSDRDVEKTKSGNFIVTKEGLRFMEPLTIVNAAGEEKTISEFKFVNNFSLALVDNESAVLNAGTFVDVLDLNHPNWKLDVKSLNGDLKSAFDRFNAELKALYDYKSAAVSSVNLTYDTQNKSYKIVFNLKTGSKDSESDSYFVSFKDVDGGVKMTLDGPCTPNDQSALNAYTELQSIMDLLTSDTLTYTYLSDCGPRIVTFTFGNSSLEISAVASK